MNPMHPPYSRLDAVFGPKGAKAWRHGAWGVLMGVGLLLAGGCDLQLERPGLDEVRRRGTLVVLTRNSPTTYFEKQDSQIGFEYDMIVSLAEYLHVVPQFKVYNTNQELLEALLQGQGDVVAAGVTASAELRRRYRFGPTYMEVEQEVVCHRAGKRPRSLERLNRVKLMVVRGSAHEMRLRQLRQEVPQLRWASVADISTEEALEMVWRREADCTVADSNVVAFNRRYFPELTVQFPIDTRQPMAWVLPKRSSALELEIRSWFKQFKSRGDFDRIHERYYGALEWGRAYDFFENRTFLERVDERLPMYKSYFELAEKKYGLSWKLLAALAYQESHWDITAISPTGVRGIMMLTADTARHIGVRNRLDPRESILGGSWYLAELMRTLPADIKEPDRTWIGLAAYNVGLGHILDARELAQDFGLNPSEWPSLRKVLPLLSHRKYYETLKHGYARGSEPVHFVRNIRRYLDLLEGMDAIVPMRSLRLRALDEGEGLLDEADSDEIYDPSQETRLDEDGLPMPSYEEVDNAGGQLTLGRMFEDVLEDLDESGQVETAVHYLMDLLHLERDTGEKNHATRTAKVSPPVVPLRAVEKTALPEPALLAVSSAAVTGGMTPAVGAPIHVGGEGAVTWTIHAGVTPGAGIVVVVPPPGNGMTPVGGVTPGAGMTPGGDGGMPLSEEEEPEADGLDDLETPPAPEPPPRRVGSLSPTSVALGVTNTGGVMLTPTTASAAESVTPVNGAVVVDEAVASPPPPEPTPLRRIM